MSWCDKKKCSCRRKSSHFQRWEVLPASQVAERDELQLRGGQSSDTRHIRFASPIRDL